MMLAYLQYSNGDEVALSVTRPDPEDGTYCIHIPESLPEVLEKDAYGNLVKATRWVRVIPE